jgi:hypothetical protein
MAWTNPKTWSAGETLTAANFNTHIRDNLNALASHLVVRKPSDESVTSSVTFQADDHLLMAVGVNEVWLFKFVILVQGATAGDFAARFTFPSGTFSALGLGISTTSVQGRNYSTTTSPTTQNNFDTDSATIPQPVIIEGVHVNGGSAGNIVLEWAQAASNATATTVKANSTLWAVKLA